VTLPSPVVDLIDIGAGNFGSMSRCLERLGIPYRVVGPDSPPQGDRPLILPGVGSFGGFMQALRRNGFDQILMALLREGTPYLGVCVGLQVLFESSAEAPGVKGLGLIPGHVAPYRSGKVPQVGWNQIHSCQPDTWDDGFVYFVNSYYAIPTAHDAILYLADYSGPFCAAVQAAHLTAFQFHPEKSGAFGHSLMARWVSEQTGFSADLDFSREVRS